MRAARNADWIAALPMYDFPPLHAEHDALWTAMSERLADAGLTAVPPRLSRSFGHLDLLGHPLLLFGQTCEYPLANSWSDPARIVGTPCYTAPGCSGSTYRSAIVVRKEDSVEGLSGLRNRRCAVNEWNSNSGMNLLRAAIAPLSGGRPFFKSVVLSRAHRRSAELVVQAQADVAAIDCVSFAHMQRLYPAEMAPLRVLCWTAPSPSLPFITARGAGEATLLALRESLADMLRDNSLAAVRDALLLQDVDFRIDENFTRVKQLELRATQFSYPILC